MLKNLRLTPDMYIHHFQLLIITIIGVSAYELKCPHRSHWQQRAIIHKCDKKTTYHCLNDINSKKWTEICSQPNDLPPGNAVKFGIAYLDGLTFFYQSISLRLPSIAMSAIIS